MTTADSRPVPFYAHKHDPKIWELLGGVKWNKEEEEKAAIFHGWQADRLAAALGLDLHAVKEVLQPKDLLDKARATLNEQAGYPDPPAIQSTGAYQSYATCAALKVFAWCPSSFAGDLNSATRS